MDAKQCVACNREIPDSCRSCQCGHVQTETRTIAGKRFSDYRAELYTRLVIEESRKQARKPRAKRISSNVPKVQQESSRGETSSPNIFRGKRRKRRSRPMLLKRNVTAEKTDEACEQRADKQLSTKTTTEDSATVAEPSVHATKSFTSALAEINKRLRNQSRLWACLSSGLPLSANT